MRELCVLLILLAQGAAQVTQNPRFGAIQGRLVSVDGMPASGVRVAAIQAQDDPATFGETILGVTQTDGNGSYHLDNLPPGRYYIAAGLLEVPTFYPGAGARNAARVLTVTAGALTNGLDFQLLAASTGLRIAGRVVREGDPQSYGSRTLTIELFSAPPPRGVSAQPIPARVMSLGANGSFEFQRVPPGAYRLTVNPGIQMTAFDVTVTDKDITDLRIPLPTSAVVSAEVTGTVTVERAGLMPVLRFRLEPVPGQPGSQGYLTVIASPFSIEAPIGEFRVTANRLPPGYSIRSMMADSTDLLTGNLKVTVTSTPRITISLGVSAPPPWVGVSGRLIGPGRADAIQLGTLGGSFEQLTVPVAPDGSFAFPMVLPGTYPLRLVPRTDEFLRTVVVGNQDVSNLEIPVVIPAFKVAGTISGETGRAQQRQLANQVIRASLTPDRRVQPGVQSFSAEVAADGTFTLPRVSPGAYTLRFALSTRGSDSGQIVGESLNLIITDKDVANLVIPALNR